MRSTTTTTTTAAVVAATLVGSAAAIHEKMTFATLGFRGNEPLTEGCMDPIVTPGGRSAHAHTIMGASNFGTSATGESLFQSDCTNANVPGDNSAYWMPKLYFQDPSTKKFEDVKLYYSKVYYFFDETDDDIKPFPLGLQMISGDAQLRTPPASGGNIVMDPEDGEVQPAQWTCPQEDMTKVAYAPDSDGSHRGIKNSAPSAFDFGSGFPTEKCDRIFSPLRADLHFPSCYNPDAALNDWKNNMAWPSRKYQRNGSGRANCPPGFIHVPRLFFEYYWNTIEFMSRWTVDGVNQPFLLANGDRTGFSLHGDFISGWDSDILANIIDNCDAGTLGMDKCIQGLNIHSLPKCNIQSEVVDTLTGVMDELPCGNTLSGWGVDGVGSVASGSDAMDYEPAEPVEPNSTVQVAEESTLAVNVNIKAEAPAPEDQYYPAGLEAVAQAASADPVTAAAVVASSEPEADDNYNGEVVTEWITETVVVSTTVLIDASPEQTGAEYKLKRSPHVHAHAHKHKRHGF